MGIRYGKVSNAITGCFRIYSLSSYTQNIEIRSLGKGKIAMKRGLATLVSAVALTASANAADIYSGGGYKDDGYVPVNTWSGFYIGANGGYGWNADVRGGSNVSSFADDAGPTGTSPVKSFDSNGGFGGVQIGRNWQVNRLVLGVETDIQWSGIKGSGSAHAGADPHGAGADVTADANAKSELDWFGTVRGRVGYSFDRALVYATAGLAYGGVKDTLSLKEGGTDGSTGFRSTSKDNTEVGVALGAGLEYALTPAWSLKGEYQYLDLRHFSEAVAIPADRAGNSASASSNGDHTYHTVRVGINYHFAPGYEPLK
jgi:outer membrane immunogenic protein